jgi:hypothetical protein
VVLTEQLLQRNWSNLKLLISVEKSLKVNTITFPHPINGKEQGKKVDQTLSNQEEPLFQLLNVEPEQYQLDMKRRCPFIGLSYDPDTVMSFPTHRNYCHRVKVAQSVRIDYQSTYCLSFEHRHCPVLLKKSTRSLPSEMAVQSVKKQPTTMALSFTVVVILMAIGLLLFGGWQWTRASEWFADPDSAPAQQEVIQAPDQQVQNQAEPLPAIQPTESLPTTELPLDQAPAADSVPPTPASIPSSGT